MKCLSVRGLLYNWSNGSLYQTQVSKKKRRKRRRKAALKPVELPSEAVPIKRRKRRSKRRQAMKSKRTQFDWIKDFSMNSDRQSQSPNLSFILSLCVLVISVLRSN